VLCGNGF